MTKTPDSSTISVRRASPDDAQAIAEIGVAGWQAAYRGILPAGYLRGLNVVAREVAWRMRLESDDDDMAPSWVADRAGRAIGFVASGPPRDDDLQPAEGSPRIDGSPPPTAEIYAIYVQPDAWRSGAGRAMLSTAVQEWRQRGTTGLVLWVLEANAAGRAFYEHVGWRPDGGRQDIDLGGVTVTEVRYRFQELPLGWSDTLSNSSYREG